MVRIENKNMVENRKMKKWFRSVPFRLGVWTPMYSVGWKNQESNAVGNVLCKMLVRTGLKEICGPNIQEFWVMRR